jgi:hypothetical protein
LLTTDPGYEQLGYTLFDLGLVTPVPLEYLGLKLPFPVARNLQILEETFSE